MFQTIVFTLLLTFMTATVSSARILMALNFDITFQHVNTEYHRTYANESFHAHKTRLCFGLLNLSCAEIYMFLFSELILFTSSIYYMHFTLPAVPLRFDNGSIMQNLPPLPSTLNTLTNVLTAEQVYVKLRTYKEI